MDCLKHAALKSTFKSKMTVRQYNSMLKSERWEFLWAKGNLVDQALAQKSSFLLYSVDTFFVEIEFSLENGKALNIKAICEASLIEKYLNKIILLIV